MPASSPRRLVAEPVDDLPPRPAAVALALAPLAGARRLGALSGAWDGAPFLLTADPVDVRDHLDVPADLDVVLAELDEACRPVRRGAGVPAGAVGGGRLVVMGHAVGRSTGRVRVPLPGVVGPRLPAVHSAFHDHVLRFDGERWWAESLDTGDGEATARALRLASAARAGLSAAAVTRHAATSAGSLVPPDAVAHMAAVEQVVHAIRAGDIAQANVCARFALRLADASASALGAWLTLVERLAPDRAALVTAPWGALVGASPELYLRLADGRVHSAPIKGTRPADDARALLESVKDTSENVMIVDLVRNDLSRVCVPGTVAVDELLAVRPHTGVAHLVSEVSGRLQPDAGVADVLRATFPPGSVTGTPKQRATEITDALEPAARGAHTGAVGLLGPRLAELAVTIRSLEVAPDGSAALGVGGGIVADSTPAEEWHEVCTKAAPLLAGLGLDPPTPSPATRARKGLADPAAGLIETVLAVDGRVVELADHLARLRRSVWELTGQGLGATVDLEAELSRAALRAGQGAHRLRVRVPLGPGRTGPTGVAAPGPAVVETEPWYVPVLPGRSAGLVLGWGDAPATGLERHKYADRTWLDEACAARPAGSDDVVLRTPDGELLETTRACLLVLRGTSSPAPVELLTPPLDGRLLPGVTRQVCLDLARRLGWAVRLGRVDEDVLETADALLVCNALRGVQWVARLGRHSWDAPAPAASVLAAALLGRWRLPGGEGAAGPPAGS